MSEVKTIKGVSKEKWTMLKTLAASKNLPMGDFLEVMIEDYSKKGGDNWDKILNGKKNLTDSEANELEKTLHSLRKEKGFRI